jgi:hypothetical protein
MSLAADSHKPDDGLPEVSSQASLQPSETDRAATQPQSPKQHAKWISWFIADNHQPTTLGHVVLSSSMLAAIIVSYWVMFWFAGIKQAEWLGGAPVLTQEEINTSIAVLSPTPAERIRLVDQYRQIENRVQKHADIMGFFYRQYFISLSMICGASIVASVCLFFISKLGWERVNNALINIFIVSTSTIIFYGNISLVFKQEENIKDNQILYLGYFSLRNEMLSYWVTQQASTGDPVTPAKFIHYMDGRLQELNQIRLGFDATRITTLGDQMNQLNPADEQQPQLRAK